MDLEKIQKIIDDVEAKKNELAEYKGAHKENKKRLKTEHGCSTLQEAEQKRRKLKRSLSKKMEEIKKMIKEYETKLSQIKDIK